MNKKDLLVKLQEMKNDARYMGKLANHNNNPMSSALWGMREDTISEIGSIILREFEDFMEIIKEYLRIDQTYEFSASERMIMLEAIRKTPQV
jgi:hypothetical protein